MNSHPYLTLDKDVAQLRPADVQAFGARISGGLLTGTDGDYDAARKVWNATVDRRPALIARCRNEDDVQAAVRFAAAQRMLLSVRSGGQRAGGRPDQQQPEAKPAQRGQPLADAGGRWRRTLGARWNGRGEVT